MEGEWQHLSSISVQVHENSCVVKIDQGVHLCPVLAYVAPAQHAGLYRSLYCSLESPCCCESMFLLESLKMSYQRQPNVDQAAAVRILAVPCSILRQLSLCWGCVLSFVKEVDVVETFLVATFGGGLVRWISGRWTHAMVDDVGTEIPSVNQNARSYEYRCR